MRPSEKLAPTKAAGMLAGLAFCLLAAGCGPRGQAECDTPSRQPVPRFVALEYNEINARKGPGEDHRILWTWRAKGMPVEVVAETSDWRKVRGPDGIPAWVHKRGLTGDMTVMRIKPGAVALRASPKDDAPVVAWFKPSAVAALEKSEGDWRALKASGTRGWVRASEVWGAGGPTPCLPRER